MLLVRASARVLDVFRDSQVLPNDQLLHTQSTHNHGCDASPSPAGDRTDSGSPDTPSYLLTESVELPPLSYLARRFSFR